jgi:hypothetical protein
MTQHRQPALHPSFQLTFGHADLLESGDPTVHNLRQFLDYGSGDPTLTATPAPIDCYIKPDMSSLQPEAASTPQDFHVAGLDADVDAQMIQNSTLDAFAMAGLRLGGQMIASERETVVNATDADDEVRIWTAQARDPLPDAPL